MKITQRVFEHMARETEDPFLYILATVEMGFRALSDKQDIVSAWNRNHPEKKLPMPKRQGE